MDVDFNPDTHTSTAFFTYNYRDVLITKQNSKGDFEWFKNSPLRIDLELNFGLVYKQYIAVATDKNIFILNDEYGKNMKRIMKGDYSPDDLTSIKEFPGSNFVSTSFATSDGKMEHKLIFENDGFTFAPCLTNKLTFMPSSKSDLFIPYKPKEIIIYTDNRGKDSFSKIKFD